MGDQIGVAVSGTVYYVPFHEFERVRSLEMRAVRKAEIFAQMCRINALYMIASAGSGHIGSSFSSLDIVSWLYLNELGATTNSDGPAAGDIFFSSKGHDAPAIYSALIGLGRLEFDLLHTLRRLGGLPGHPDVATPGIVTNTGSLGMGISKAKGMILANRLLKRPGAVFVLTGDGELQEGQLWESLMSAANLGLGELTVIVDHNKLQSDTLVAKVSDLGDLEAKFAAFGWHVARCDGNDIEALSGVLKELGRVRDRPKVVIADTVKGKGVSFMEHTATDSDVEFYRFHSGAPTADAYTGAVQELIEATNRRLASVAAEPLELEKVARPSLPAAETPQRLVNAYSAALLEAARRDGRIVVLDADLVVDTGLVAFRKEFPERFIECGIAEQDMVSQAGGLALKGLLPVVHSFACFLSARPNEQIYNNATERTKIIYVGSLAGVVPGGPGHSHQAVRDLSTLGAVPGLVMAEPCCESEVGMLLDWCVNEAAGACYLRLTSLPWPVSYRLPDDYALREGEGVALTEGSDVVVTAYGPVLLSAAVSAARRLAQSGGPRVKVINLPWLNRLDVEWLAGEVGDCRHILALDNHYRIGGQGDRIADAVSSGALGAKRLHRIAIEDIPVCGTNSEVLAWHGLTETKIGEALAAVIAS